MRIAAVAVIDVVESVGRNCAHIDAGHRNAHRPDPDGKEPFQRRADDRKLCVVPADDEQGIVCVLQQLPGFRCCERGGGVNDNQVEQRGDLRHELAKRLMAEMGRLKFLHEAGQDEGITSGVADQSLFGRDLTAQHVSKADRRRQAEEARYAWSPDITIDQKCPFAAGSGDARQTGSECRFAFAWAGRSDANDPCSPPTAVVL